MMSGLKIQAPGFCNKFSVIQTNYHVKVIIKLCEVLNVFRLLLLCSIELVPNAQSICSKDRMHASLRCSK